MLVQISEIKLNAGRREASSKGVRELADSISKVGLLNPITVDQGCTLIAGLHRLEAAKSLGWTEIECTVSSLEGLLAELAEVDENVVRKGLSAVRRIIWNTIWKGLCSPTWTVTLHTPKILWRSTWRAS